MFLNIGVMELARFASKNPTRESLRYVKIVQNATHIVATATNGSVLAEYSSPLLSDKEQASKEIYLCAEEVLKALRSVPLKVRKEGAILDVKAGTLTFGPTTHTVSVRSVVGFPDTNRIKEASYSAPAAFIDLDLQLLADINTYLKSVGHSTIVTMELHGELEPVALGFRHGGTDVQFFVMPCRR